MKKIMLMISVIILISISGCERWFTTAVRYEVQCDPPGFKVYYTDAKGGEAFEKSQDYLWSKNIVVKEEINEVCLTASPDSFLLDNLIDNLIIARIYVEGTLALEDSSHFTIFHKCVEL